MPIKKGRKSMPLKCLDNGIVYESITKAAECLNVHPSSFSYAKKKAITKGLDYFFCGDYEFEFQISAKESAYERRARLAANQKRCWEKKK